MFAITVRFDLRDETAAEAFDALLAEALPLITEREPGTLAYLTHTVVDEPLGRVFYEVYADRDAHAEHEASPHTAHFLQAIQEHVVTVRVDLLQGPVGKGSIGG